MTYIASETSVQDGDPIYRFQFTQNTAYFRYTSAPYFSLGGEVTSNDIPDSNGQFHVMWEPAAITVSSITQSGEMGKDSIKLSFPRDNAFAQLFLGGVPESVTTVTIFRGHAGDNDGEFVVYWKGRVSAASAKINGVDIECENIFTSLRRPGLRARYQKNCRHALYRRGCGINEATVAVAGTCTAASGFTITVTQASSQPNGYYTGGMVKTNDGYLRYITSHTGTSLTLSRPLQSLIDDVNSSAGTASVTIYPGCDHTRGTCLTKFGNLDNYGGFPWIPSKNPFNNSVSGSVV